ncbi:DUF1206 domain-containing protein [Salegentibacter sediminis]|uniref:DUF1206 domain-containing protein n=1 Tax=Salegentibacter sediminis TaxID=1930251 RepID=UPI0009C098D8|nr:DUF1206 domain-containing protein [Salegentibacter sediminis]
MNSKLKKVARTGYAAKAVVYGLIGILTLLAAFNMGGQTAGKLKVIDFLEKQTFGNVLLALIALGLLCYSGWRFFQAIKDPENIGKDMKAKAKRFGFFISGLLYLSIAGYAVMKLLNAGSTSQSGSGQNGMINSFLTGDSGVYVFTAIGIGLVATSFFQFKKAFYKDFLKKFDYKSISEEKRRRTIKNTGYLGLIARGIIFAILAYFFVRAAVAHNTTDIKSTTDAFAFLRESPMGSWLMGTVAAGMICYSIYVFMMVKYRKFRT